MACCSSLNTDLNLSTLNINTRNKNPTLPIDYGFRPLLPQNRVINSSVRVSSQAQASICVRRSMRWWEDKSVISTNMVEIQSAQQLVDTLRHAGDRLVILDFYSPGCGGCRTLHPKICQIAESNPDALFLKVNLEQMHTMCECLNVHVLPFFRFYRGSEGRLCSFSCTNSTIKKFKDAIGKHSTDRCSLGPAKGLEESEIARLVASQLIPEKGSSPPLPAATATAGEGLMVKELIRQAEMGKELASLLLL
ncbi:Thioredoxin-like 1-2, chloroplastic [Linum perenne]